uniref:Uncharacterized protein n=1 Tax=Panagrolaimus sp. JU765 TaxID=591449 RepID=A0AC34RIG1_9BILA
MWRGLFFAAFFVPAISWSVVARQCYDSAQGRVVRCASGVTECYTSFVKVGERDARVLTGCYSKNNSSSNEHGSVCALDDKNGKICVCSSDMCNDETHYESITCNVSNDTEPAKLTKCPIGTTHCYSVATLETCPLKTTGCFVARDPKTQKLIEAGCDVSDHGSQLVEKCSSDGCNYPMYCYDSSKDAMVHCEVGVTSCFIDRAKIGDDYAITSAGCAVPGQSKGCSMKNGTKTCICHADNCNQDVLEIKCYIANQTTPATLEVCPFEATGCFVARDPKTQKLIEAGCDVSDHGSQLVEKCSSDGCNYPMYCYDSSKNAIVQCEVGVTSCYTDFAKTGLDHTITSAGCAVPGQNEGCSMKNGKKTCICHGDNCNQNFEIKCYIANQSTPATLEVCPFEAVGCYVARDEQTGKLIEAGCDVGDEGGHHVEKCFGDGCNHPFHCYDVGRNNVQQCDHHITTCFTTFEKADGVLKTSSGCDFGKFGFPLPSNGST